MSRVIQVSDGTGGIVNAIEIDFEIKREEWNEYLLVDGGRVRLRTVLYKVLRVVDEEGKPKYTAEGDPAVIFRLETKGVTSE